MNAIDTHISTGMIKGESRRDQTFTSALYLIICHSALNIPKIGERKAFVMKTKASLWPWLYSGLVYNYQVLKVRATLQDGNRIIGLFHFV